MIARFGHRILEESEYTCEHTEIYAQTRVTHRCEYTLVARTQCMQMPRNSSTCFRVPLTSSQTRRVSRKQIQPMTLGRESRIVSICPRNVAIKAILQILLPSSPRLAHVRRDPRASSRRKMCRRADSRLFLPFHGENSV